MFSFKGHSSQIVWAIIATLLPDRRRWEKTEDLTANGTKKTEQHSSSPLLRVEQSCMTLLRPHECSAVHVHERKHQIHGGHESSQACHCNLSVWRLRPQPQAPSTCESFHITSWPVHFTLLSLLLQAFSSLSHVGLVRKDSQDLRTKRKHLGGIPQKGPDSTAGASLFQTVGFFHIASSKIPIPFNFLCLDGPLLLQKENLWKHQNCWTSSHKSRGMKGFKLHTVGLLTVFAGPSLSFHSTIEWTKEKHGKTWERLDGISGPRGMDDKRMTGQNGLDRKN